MSIYTRVPYSPAGLERLASALNVSTAALWVNPVGGGFGLRRPPSTEVAEEVEEPPEGERGSREIPGS